MNRTHLHSPLRRGRLRAAALATIALALGLATSACTPTPGTVDVAGDSVSAQAFGYTAARPGVTAVADREMVGAGWGCSNVEATLRRHVNAARPEILILALGPNDASDGWDRADRACFDRLVDDILDPTACAVVVLPAWGAPLDGTQWAADMGRARNSLVAIAGERSAAGRRTVIVDWSPIVAEHPEYLDAGGIHKGNAEAAEARLQLYADGADQCGAA